VLDEAKEFIQQSDEWLARYLQCDQSRQRPERVFTPHGDFSVSIIA